jgi:hypothetical protein
MRERVIVHPHGMLRGTIPLRLRVSDCSLENYALGEKKAMFLKPSRGTIVSFCGIQRRCCLEHVFGVSLECSDGTTGLFYCAIQYPNHVYYNRRVWNEWGKLSPLRRVVNVRFHPRRNKLQL